ncbi:phage virion morphogenesis protein [Sphingomonas jatrophae]|uniref:Phage virion morphogenesis (Putative tail completion) protein n=1 Tax=Sphingomonas jatrophae TaxID=1166337 RepID=A0A1I6JLD0_9SPHN|nr:phage virion morphogenesis protein [Sphingomonas jatrophae]SFR79796.1 phage virion morphogenesis (putative tail completion) protein [Sphingomonas jatrophae]
MDDLAEIEQLAGQLLRRLGPGERRRTLRAIAREIRSTQSARIARQQDPSGAAFSPRRVRDDPKLGAYAVRFLYPRGAAEPRVVFMKSWLRQGDMLTGFDIEARAVRSFRWDRVDQFLPIDATDRNKSSGKLRRKGRIRNAAMFRKLRSGRFLRSGATDAEAWIGFAGRAAEIARIHQDGGLDRPSPKVKPVRYARRTLVGLTEAERARILDLLLEHVAAR